MNILKVLMATALALIVTGCAAPLPRADVTTFHQWSGEGKRSFELVRQGTQKDRLEHANYGSIVRTNGGRNQPRRYDGGIKKALELVSSVEKKSLDESRDEPR